jgi:GDP-L-fucose synthase
MVLAGKTVLLTGGHGFLGRFVHEALLRRGVDPSRIRRPRSSEADLREREQCRRAVEGADIVIHLAARVGGIGFNRRNPATIFYDNIVMGVHLIDAASRAGVQKFVQVGTVCAYPKFTPVPFREDTLWQGYPEETNAPYGLAKKSLLVQAQAYRDQFGLNAIYLLPTNLYGPGDNFDPDDSHVIPALIRKCVEAAADGRATIEAWGSGNPSREFLYVADCAEGIALAAERYDGREPVNLGSGEEITIRDLVSLVAAECGYRGAIRWDPSSPDGQPRRCLDTSRARAFGFSAHTHFRDGLRETVRWYRESLAGR